MDQKEKILWKFGRINRITNLSNLLWMNLTVARHTGLDQAIRDTEDLGESAFYLKIFLRLHGEEIMQRSGEEISRHVNMNDPNAILLKIKELGVLKSIEAQKQNYPKAAEYRDQQGWLVKRLDELARKENNN
jgi:hypothetical protein